MSDTALQRMLSGELPLERVGPHLRHACRRALRSGDPQRMRLAAKVVVEELARKGELLQVSIEGDKRSAVGVGPFCMVRGKRNVLDLSILGLTDLQLPASAPISPPVSPQLPPPEAPAKGIDLDTFDGMLVAMEQAQNLDIGDPRSGEKVVILNSILWLLGRFTPHYPLFIMLHEQEILPEDQQVMFHVAPDEADSGWLTVRTPGHSVWIPNPAELPRHIRQVNTVSHDGSFRRAVAVPLWEPQGNGVPSQGPQESGLLFLVSRQDMGRDQLLRLAERLSRFVTRRWQHQREVNHRIHVDGLTGVYNRAFFDQQFPLELERARRSEIPLTLVVADLDKFKRINDTYGHAAGDTILRMVARRLHEELRRIDLICRIGGEELALILPDTSQESAQDVMSRLLDSSFTAQVTSEEKTLEISVTFSYGAVSFPAAGADPFELFRKADAMMYLSKDLGRNRCHFWNSDGDHLQLLPSDPGI